MLSTLLRTIAAHDLFRPGDKVVVAVSGGDAGGFEGKLHEARAIDAETGAPAPQVGRADEAFRKLDDKCGK